VERGQWIDPPGADLALGAWGEQFLALARRLSPTTVQTYRRDLNRYILPRFGGYRIGRLPADEIENWLNDEVAAGFPTALGKRSWPAVTAGLWWGVATWR
jgi:hypothetical protein